MNPRLTKKRCASWILLVLVLTPTSVACGARLRAPSHKLACSLVAAPNGSNSARGSINRPYRTVRRLLRALRPGSIGCLRAGVYAEDVTIRRGGRPRDPLTLRSFPGERATIRGRLYLARGASYTTIENLNLDGNSETQDCSPVRCPSPTVDANHTVFSYDDVTDDHTAICFDVGSDRYGAATGTVITHDSVHDCGVLPAAGHNHGIYLQAAHDTLIRSDLIYDNADRGIQLYPEATRSLIEDNVIVGNGEGIDFGALGSSTASYNLVQENLIVDSVHGYNVSSYYGPSDRVGTGNLVVDNCIGGGAGVHRGSPLGVGEAIGFQLRRNVREPSSPGATGRSPLTRANHAVRTTPHGACARIIRLIGTSGILGSG